MGGGEEQYRELNLESNKAYRASLGKSRKAVPEVWCRIVHIADDHFKSSHELSKQTFEAAVGPDGAFENGNIGVLTSQCPLSAGSALSHHRGTRHGRYGRLTRPSKPRTPPVVETFCKAIAWRQELDFGAVASRPICPPGKSDRASVTQALMVLRLVPKVRSGCLPCQPRRNAAISERTLRSIDASLIRCNRSKRSRRLGNIRHGFLP